MVLPIRTRNAKKTVLLVLLVVSLFLNFFAFYIPEVYGVFGAEDIVFEYGAETGTLQPPWDVVRGDGVDYGLINTTTVRARNGSRSIYMYQQPPPKDDPQTLRRCHLRYWGSSHDQQEAYISWWVYFDDNSIDSNNADDWGPTLGGFQLWFGPQTGKTYYWWTGGRFGSAGSSGTNRRIQFSYGWGKIGGGVDFSSSAESTEFAWDVSDGDGPTYYNDYKNTWLHLQVYYKIHQSAGAVSAWINGTLIGQETGMKTDPRAYSEWNNNPVDGDVCAFRSTCPDGTPNIGPEVYQGTDSFENWIWVDDVILATEYVPDSWGGATEPTVTYEFVQVLEEIEDTTEVEPEVTTTYYSPIAGVLINGTEQTNASGYATFLGLTNNTIYTFISELPTGYTPRYVLNANGSFSWNGTHFTAQHNITDPGGTPLHFVFSRYQDVYVTSCSATLTKFVITGQTLTYRISADSGVTSETLINCQDREEPTFVRGATSWSYNEITNILAINVTHASPEEVEVEWVPPVPPPPVIPPLPPAIRLAGNLVSAGEGVVFRTTLKNTSFVMGEDTLFYRSLVDDKYLWLDKSYSASSYTRYCIYGTSPNDIKFTVDRWFPTTNSSAQLTINTPYNTTIALEFHSLDLISAYATGVLAYSWNATTQTLSMTSNTEVDPIIIYANVVEQGIEVPPVNVGVEITNMEGCGNWVFSGVRYYNFRATYWDGNGYTDLNEMKVRFYNHGQMITVVYDQSDNEFTIEAGGDYIRLRAIGTTVLDAFTLQVDFGIWFENTVIDEFNVSIYMYCNDVTGLEDTWDLMAPDYFHIYSLGGHSSLETYGNAGRLAGGDVFDLWAETGGWAESTVIFRNLQHVKFLPEVAFNISQGYWELSFFVDYCTEGTDDFIEGWGLVLNATDLFIGNERHLGFQVDLYNRGTHQATANAYMHHSSDGATEITTSRFWIDLWFNRINASSTVGGRANAYYFPMINTAHDWLRWLTGNNWGIDEEKVKECMLFTNLLDADNTTILYAPEIKLVRVRVKLDVPAGTLYFQNVSLSNYDVFDLTFGTDPFEGIQTPVFDETKVPVMPQGGFLGALTSWFSKLIQKLAEFFGPALLAFWDSFVGFMDTIFTQFGWTNGFSQILSFIGNLSAWVVQALTFVVSMLAIGYIFITEVFVHVFTFFEGFIDTLGSMVGFLAWMWEYLYPYWGWAPDVIMQILPLIFVFFALWLASPLLDKNNWHGTKQRIEDTIGLLLKIVMFGWLVFERLVGLVFRLAEMVPVIE